MNKFYKDRKEIIDWLYRHNIENYELVSYEKYVFAVDVYGDVSLNGRDCYYIPIKFNKINGSFDCSGNKLASLEFCPEYISGDFYCDNNELVSLEFCPKKVGGVFDCSHNSIQSLEFCPYQVKGDFYSHDNFFDEVVQNQKSFTLAYALHKKTVATLRFDKLNSDIQSNKLIDHGVKMKI